MSWINNPELTSDQKEKIYYESMEKAMDAGGKLALSEVPMFQFNLAQLHHEAKKESQERADAFLEALELSCFHFKAQEGVDGEVAWESREAKAQEVLSLARSLKH